MVAEGVKSAPTVIELARELATAYPDEPPCMVSVIDGARVFARSLMRNLAWPVEVHEIRAASYGGGTSSNGDVQVTGPDLPVSDRRVLLIEDIVDTGLTADYLMRLLEVRGPRSLKLCSLLDKPGNREVEVPVDFVGFTIPDEFVVGYGLDLGELYRNLPHIAVYTP